MLKRLTLMGIALAILFALSAPMIVSAEEEAYAEGIHYTRYWAHGSFSGYTSLTATKQVDGDWRQTSISITSGGRHQQTRTLTGILMGDPDGLEVSEDLGWGGLDGQAVLVDTQTGISYLYEFHLQSTAIESAYTENPANWYFERPSLVEGVIVVDSSTTIEYPGTGTDAHAVYGINFSDQWPGY